MSKIPRKERRVEPGAEHLDTMAFLRLADKFIDVANRQNARVVATELHMAFLYAAARYNAHVANSVLQVEDHEAFVADMTAQYQEMLRQNLADPTLAGDTGEKTD